MLGKLGKGLRILAPDFPGFGDSQPFPAEVDFGPDLMADFWDKFLDAATVSEQRVKSVFILNTLFQRDYPWHSWARIWQRPVMGEMSMLIFNRYMMRREMRAYAPGVPPELVDEGYSRMHRTMRRTLLRTYRAYSRPAEVFDPWEQRLSEALADIPVYVLWGDQDPYIGKEFAERYGVDADHRPDLGHWLHLQEPGLVAETLGTFLQDYG
jgi:pimeloyl-ACP methyl ester carboxylesterase